MLATMLHVGFPDADYRITECTHVRVLRTIKRNAFGLAYVRHGKVVRVAVPIIPVELNNGSGFRHKRIDAKLSSNQFLPFVDYAQLIQQGITCTLKSIWLERCLLFIHVPKHSGALGISIAASEGAVGWVALLDSRFRPLKIATAYFADKRHFVAGLPFIRMGRGAKVAFGLPAFWKNDWNGANCATRLDLKSCAMDISAFTGACNLSSVASTWRNEERCITDYAALFRLSRRDSLAAHTAKTGNSTSFAVSSKWRAATLADSFHASILAHCRQRTLCSITPNICLIKPKYQADIRRRMALALAGPDERAREGIKVKGLPVDYGPLFANREAAE